MASITAPFLQDIAGGTIPGAAWWATASDDIRIRVGAWRPEGAKGTVLIFPGRTEFIEKYGETAGEFAKRGLATLAIDWRGQGLADRLIPDRRLGHVRRFTHYQRDVAAALELADTLDLPRPWHIHGHSMGGAIALRTIMEKPGITSCGFTGPMWGIRISPGLRQIGWAISEIAPVIGLGHMITPTSSPKNYVLSEGFDGNTLTKDSTMFRKMRADLVAHPELALGGPTLTWLREALRETRHLASLPSPDMPCICIVGSAEKIVDINRIEQRMARWPKGNLLVLPGAEHEVLMDLPAKRDTAFRRLAEHFAAPH